MPADSAAVIRAAAKRERVVRQDDEGRGAEHSVWARVCTACMHGSFKAGLAHGWWHASPSHTSNRVRSSCAAPKRCAADVRANCGQHDRRQVACARHGMAAAAVRQMHSVQVIRWIYTYSPAHLIVFVGDFRAAGGHHHLTPADPASCARPVRWCLGGHARPYY